MTDQIERFAAQHFTINSITDLRRVRVVRGLRRYEEFLSVPIEQATDAELRDWMVELLDDGLAASTVAWYLKMTRSFYRWAWLTRLIEPDTFMRIQTVKQPRGASSQAPRPYSRKELALMWRQLDERWPAVTERQLARWQRGTSKYVNVRRGIMRIQLDAIIELALVCGLRRNEIYALSIDDCHWDNKYIVVHGKRVDQFDKVREVPYPDSTRTAIRRWFKVRGALSPQPGLPLWLSVTGREPANGMSPDRIARVLQSFGDWSLHRLRHTAATERLRAGMELEHLQRFLGHSNLQQTLRYAKLIRGDIHKSSERIDAEFQRAIKPHIDRAA